MCVCFRDLVVQTDRSNGAVVANRCRPPMFFGWIVQVVAKVVRATRGGAFGRTFPPSSGSDGCNQARFADDVHHPSEVIGENMRHLGGDIPWRFIRKWVAPYGL